MKIIIIILIILCMVLKINANKVHDRVNDVKILSSNRESVGRDQLVVPFF